MVNAIASATTQLRSNENESDVAFNPIHIFHTEESLHRLTTSELPWRQALGQYGIAASSLVHHVTSLDESTEDRFQDLVRQLATIVNPLENAKYYVDLTGGVSSLKTILAVFAYVLDLEHLYSLEIAFADDPAERRRQLSMFLPQLETAGVEIRYRRFPPIRGFDTFGKTNYTEIIRHRDIVGRAIAQLSTVLNGPDLTYLRDTLLEGIRQRLVADVTSDAAAYRHAVFSSAAGVEEVANYLLAVLGGAQLDKKTLGQKLAEIRNLTTGAAGYFMTEKNLEHLTLLIGGIRNEVVHPTHGCSPRTELLALQAELASHLAMSFVHFAVKAIEAFVGPSGQLYDIEVLKNGPAENQQTWYFGFDGDATGDFLADAFHGNADEGVVAARSQAIRRAVNELAVLVRKETGNADAVVFAEGDNLLFKATFSESLLARLQAHYRSETGLTSSIGYGRTLREASIALRLAKSRGGDSRVGILIREVNTTAV